MDDFSVEVFLSFLSVCIAGKIFSIIFLILLFSLCFLLYN
nr:MAG TPA: hypothetical protein [Caudoviricetes sp.]